MKKQVQSYLSILLRGKFTIYQMRIFLKIVQRAQAFLKSPSGRYSDFIRKAYVMDGYNVNFVMPISDIIASRSHNYEPLKKSIRDMLSRWVVEKYDPNKKLWQATNVVYNVEIEDQKGILRFSCAQWLINQIADFSKFGYRVYDYDVAMRIRNPYAAKIYILMASQKNIMTYDIEEFKKWLGAEGRYKRPADFARRCLEPAKKELEQLGVNGFAYSFKKRGEWKTAPVDSIVMTPVKRGVIEAKNIGEIKAEVESILPIDIVNYLVLGCGFSYAEVSHQTSVLAAFMQLDNWQWKFTDIITRARKKRKNHGWIIQAWKREIA